MHSTNEISDAALKWLLEVSESAKLAKKLKEEQQNSSYLTFLTSPCLVMTYIPDFIGEAASRHNQILARGLRALYAQRHYSHKACAVLPILIPSLHAAQEWYDKLSLWNE